MKLNETKSKFMIVNFSRSNKFTTRLHIDNALLEEVKNMTLLGFVFSNNMFMKNNTYNLIKKANQRMTIIRKLYNFSVPTKDLVQIYCLFVRSILEFNSCVWFASITEQEKEDLERVQKIACRLILREKYLSYEKSLSILQIQTLEARRLSMALNFGKKCTKNPKMKDLFPENEQLTQKMRTREKYKVKFAYHKRLKDSAVPRIQTLLNEHSKSK